MPFAHQASIVALLLVSMLISPSNGQLLATDDFESYTANPVGQVGGMGDWTGLWRTNSQFGGGTFLSTASKIDGTQSIGLFGNSSLAGTSVSRPFPDCTNELTIQFSMRADYNVASTNVPGNRRMAFTIRNGNDSSHFGNQRISFFFAAGPNGFQWYDGVDRTNNVVLFGVSNIYDIAVTLNPANRAYSFTASNRNGGASFSYSGNWTTGADGESLGSVAFLMRGPSGAGNDAFLDSVVVQSTGFVGAVSGPRILEGASWRYFKGTAAPAAQGTNQWFNLAYNDVGWLGPSPSGFGYADCDDATALGDMQNNYVSVFTRKLFVVSNVSEIAHLTLAADYDDGFVAYINGVEVARRNMPAGAITHTNTAIANHEASRGEGAGNPNEKEFIALDPAVLVNGTNVIAVSGHNISTASTDFSLMIELYTNVSLVRGPFIQMPEPGQTAAFAWRTAALTDSAVDYGLDLSYSGGTVTNATLTRDHTIHLAGLLPGTQYYYRVRSGGVTLSEGHAFRTRPATNQSFRFIVIGDHGQGTDGMRAIADRINARTDFDAIMTVGDNIYGGGGCNFDGAPGWYDPFWFKLYEPTMRRVSTFPALGNHDWDTASGQFMVDYFRLPTNGPSSQIGKNYSFDFGNIHFVVIDTEPFDDNTTAAMNDIKTWLSNDLAATTQPWRMALLHRPPYTTVGGHGDHANVKAHIVPILKAGGVRVVWQGHNHWYERINAIDGIHYITTGAAGAGLYSFTTRKEYSAVLYRDRHSYSVVDIQGLQMKLQQFNDLDELVDEFLVDLGHPFLIDGLIDDDSWIRAQNGLRLYAAIRSNVLYVATQDAGEGNDHFIYIANSLSTQRPANWAKSGTIMQWGAFLADENDNAFHGWYGPGEGLLTNAWAYKSMTSGLNNNAPNTNGVLEGSINLPAHFGAFPQQIYLAGAPYSSAAAGALTHSAQVPAGNGDGNIQSNEFLALFTRDIALDLPVAVATSNQTAEAGMLVTLDGSSSLAPSGLPLSYSWQVFSGPGGIFGSPSASNTTFHLTNNVAGTTNVIAQLTVNDTRFDSNDVVTLTFFPMLDSDGDGLSDQEELTGMNNVLTLADPGGHITNPSDPDSDDDGMIDGHEAIAGTDPNDSQSVLKLVNSEVAGGSNVVIRWSSVDGKLYSIHRYTNLLTGAITLVTNIVATPSMNVHTVDMDAAQQSIYAIEVQP